MHYNLEFATRRVRNNLTGFFYRFHWTASRFDFTLIAFFVMSLIYLFPHLILLAVQGLPERSNSPVSCYGDQVYANAGMSVFGLFLVMSLRRYQLRDDDPHGIGLEVDMFNYAGIPMFPFFHGSFFYELYYKKPLFGPYFTPFYSHMLFMCVFHVSSIWVPIIQSKRREQENLNRIQSTMGTIDVDALLEEDFMKSKFKTFIQEKNLRSSTIVDLYEQIKIYKSSLLDQAERTRAVLQIDADFLTQDDNGLILLSAARLEEIKARIQAGNITPAIFDEAFE